MNVNDYEIPETWLESAYQAWIGRGDLTYQCMVSELHREGVAWEKCWRAADRLLQRKRKAGLIRYVGRRHWEIC